MAAMVVACESPLLGDYPPHVGLCLLMSFQDAEGNDLVEGIKTVAPEFAVESEFEVAPDQYSLLSSPNRREMGLYSGGAVAYDHYYLHPFLKFYTPDLSPDGHYLLGIGMPCPVEREQQTVTYTLTCPQLFGDELAHEIVTYWSKDPTDIANRAMLCYKVEVDGKEFTDVTHPMDGWYYYATIVLDR